ncbi:MAG TPA: methyltransferase domain-containing protein [Acidimicrobiia bacterium]
MEQDRAGAGWSGYWDGLPAGRILHEAESIEFARRLLAQVPLTRDDVVLDFGSGEGLAAEHLAPSVARIDCWDIAPSMRQSAATRLTRFQNARVLDGDPSEDPERAGTYDYVVVNSVLQYLPVAELGGVIGSWRALLKPGGSVVLSDVIPTGRPFFVDTWDLIRFAARHRILSRVILGAIREMGRRRSIGLPPLTVVDPDTLRALAAVNGLEFRQLDRGLTHFRSRYAVVLTRAT